MAEHCFRCDRPIGTDAGAPLHRAFEHSQTGERRAFCSERCVPIGLSRHKACTMLHDHNFTSKRQQGYFGAVCSGHSTGAHD
jgi:endogenous inhibitor of DNA gyrase (YacG/DUF329 family)